jgi:DNA-binding transcriptional MocR family regulator
MLAVPFQRPDAPYRQLADSLRRFIDEGTLQPGVRLPSVRLMARQRGVSPGTVVKAYGLLENLGQVEGRLRSGFYVRPRVELERPLPHVAQPMAHPSYVGMDDLAADVMTGSTDPDMIAFGWAIPDSTCFPNRRIGRMLASIVRDDPGWLARSGLNWGYEPLAREIARRYVLCGVGLSHAEVLITLGCTEALNLSIRAVAKPGDTVAVETPAAFALLQQLQILRIRVLEIPACAAKGIALDELRRALERKKIAAVIVMPNFQNPLGCTLSDAGKGELYRLLQEFDLPAVEDDVYGELHFGEQRPKPLKAWDVDGRVLHCSSFTKTLAPGLRVGWCAPGRYFEPVRRLKMASTMGTPLVLQKTLCDFLRIGGYEHHLRALRAGFQANLRRYAETIRRNCPLGTGLSRPAGGYILWIQFPPEVDTLRLYREASQQGINLAPGALFSSQPRFNNCIRINASTPWSPQVEAALKLVCYLAALQLPRRTGRSTGPGLRPAAIA